MNLHSYLHRALVAAALVIAIPTVAHADNFAQTEQCSAQTDDCQLALDCATTVFSRPGVRFMHKVRTACPKATVTVRHLPKGLQWNARRKVVEGTVKKAGSYTYQIVVGSGNGSRSHDVSLTVSDQLALPVPFMGWLSWNSVQGDVSESIVRQMVELFKQTGLYEAGWNYIMMDDLWQAGQRAADGSPQPDAVRFPHGLKPLADYVHEQGMKFGNYTDEADKTCAGAFGTHGYEAIDAQTYAQWGIDVVKCDYCHAPTEADTAKARYSAFAEALKAAGSKTMLYICEWGDRKPWTWGAEAGGVCWRVSGDVRDCWTGKDGGIGVVESIKAMKDISAYGGVNRFNDADMLCTGLHGTGKSSNDLCGGAGPGMTQDEYRTQFALWCMWSSPMALSFDPRQGSVTADDYQMLTNRRLIALNQDPMGQQADPVQEGTPDLLMLAKDLENGDVALSVTNLGDVERTATFRFALIPHLDMQQSYAATDLWTGQQLPTVSTGELRTQVRPHATQVFRLQKVQ